MQAKKKKKKIVLIWNESRKTVDIKYTSHVPIFRTDPGKFEALSLSQVPLGSFLHRVANLEAFSWESLIWIKSKRDGLFRRRKPSGLGSSKGLHIDGGIAKLSGPEFHCWEKKNKARKWTTSTTKEKKIMPVFVGWENERKLIQSRFKRMGYKKKMKSDLSHGW